MNNRSQKMGDGKFVIGLLIPLAISGVFYLFVRLFALDQSLSIMWLDRFSNFPLYNNVMHYSPYPFEFFLFFFLGVLFIPLMVPYWWEVIPSHFRGKVRKSSKKFTLGLIGGLIFLIFVIIFPWFIDPESLSDRRSGFFTYSFENPILYYAFFIFPMSIISCYFSGGIKFIYLKHLKN